MEVVLEFEGRSKIVKLKKSAKEADLRLAFESLCKADPVLRRRTVTHYATFQSQHARLNRLVELDSTDALKNFQIVKVHFAPYAAWTCLMMSQTQGGLESSASGSAPTHPSQGIPKPGEIEFMHLWTFTARRQTQSGGYLAPKSEQTVLGIENKSFSVECKNCDALSTSYTSFLDLSVQVYATLENGLASFFGPEHMTDYKCSMCDKVGQCKRRYYLEKPPKVLCVQLKRFNNAGGKINRIVKCKPMLDLKQFIHEDSPHAGSPLLYKMVSSLTHLGPTIDSGNYYTIAQC
ncbi:ubiquitin carboxyl-terminal hydrolase 33-like [Thrips palmi]|uniref:Ubiquitin carboxyl-terminal hydrolase 36 n=1 Tax=Thrips palmi TaxID=161013 RepID=A0A6P8YVE4_THRPL|nr:ubiquitin carboxyl-terminal hydrolase 33-like [Thrips palmi]